MRRRCTMKTSPDQFVVTMPPFPPAPPDSRLQSENAIFDAMGNLKEHAYKDLKDHFAGREKPVAEHPHPCCPGLAADEQLPKGLKLWDDARVGSTSRGMGWIAIHAECSEGSNKPEERWFNVRTWGSWRLAFLMARLQRGVWERRAAPSVALSNMNEGSFTIDGVKMSAAALRMAAADAARAIREREGRDPIAFGDTPLWDAAVENGTQVEATLEELEPQPPPPPPPKRQRKGSTPAAVTTNGEEAAPQVEDDLASALEATIMEDSQTPARAPAPPRVARKNSRQKYNAAKEAKAKAAAAAIAEAAAEAEAAKRAEAPEDDLTEMLPGGDDLESGLMSLLEHDVD